MRRSFRGIIVGTVTSVALCGHADILVLLLIGMAGLTGSGHVHAKERETCAVVSLGHVRDQPGGRRMTPVAGSPKLTAVNVLMTIGALGRGPSKMKIAVASVTGKPGVKTFEREACIVVIELHR